MEYSNPGLPSRQSSPCPTYVVTDCSNSEKGCNQNIAGSKLKVLREVRKCGRRPRGLMYPEDGGRHCIGCVGIIYQSARRHIPQDLNLYRTSVKISDLAYCNLSRVKWDREMFILTGRSTWNVLRLPAGGQQLYFSEIPQKSSGPSQPSYSARNKVTSFGIGRPGLEARHSLHLVPCFIMSGAISPLPVLLLYCAKRLQS